MVSKPAWSTYQITGQAGLQRETLTEEEGKELSFLKANSKPFLKGLFALVPRGVT